MAVHSAAMEHCGGPSKITNKMIIGSSNPSSGIYPKELESGPPKDISTPVLVAASFTVAK